MFERAAPEPDFRISSLSRMAQGGKWRVEAMRSYSRPVLLWFTRGQGRITVAGIKRGYGAHNAIFIPTGTMHGFDMLGQVYGHAIHFPRNSTLALPNDPLHLRIREVTAQGELTSLVDKMERELGHATVGSERAVYHHAGLISVWLERQSLLHAEKSEAYREPKAIKLAEAFTSLIERNLGSGKNVAEFAAQLGVTPTHLTRVCNETCGRSASRILQDRTIYEARHLLKTTSLPIKDISQQLGFTSAAYFTRAFQEQTGVTPTQFRNSA